MLVLARFFGIQNNKPRLENIKLIKINQIKVNPFQPRKFFDEEELQQLAESIKVHGVLQPIIVRSRDNEFELIAGERRLRASEIAGLNEIPAIVREFSDRETAELALIENIQRAQLNYLEEALAYAQLLNDFEMTQDELASRVGKSQSAIANKLRLLKLPLAVRSKIDPKIISERHARALLKLESESQQLMVVEKILEKNLTVKETELLVEEITKNISREIKKTGQRIKRVVKDVRIFLNAIRSAVKTVSEAGLETTLQEKEMDDCYEIVIRIAKKA